MEYSTHHMDYTILVLLWCFIYLDVIHWERAWETEKNFSFLFWNINFWWTILTFETCNLIVLFYELNARQSRDRKIYSISVSTLVQNHVLDTAVHISEGMIKRLQHCKRTCQIASTSRCNTGISALFTASLIISAE